MITAIASLRTACTFLICMPPFYIEEQPSINKNLKNIRQVIIAKPAFIKKNYTSWLEALPWSTISVLKSAAR